MAQFTAISVFEAALADQIKNVTNAKKRIAILRSNKAKIQKILRPITYIISSAGLEQAHVFANSDDYSKTFFIGINLYGLESFKQPVLTTLVEYIDGLCEENTARTRDWPESINRDYHFSLPDGHQITICAYVKNDSPTCRKVAVGSEMKEVIKYAIQCD